MIKVVLDTNIFISAILKPRSKPAFILDLVLKGSLELVISLSIFEEIIQVLKYPKLLRLIEKYGIRSKEIENYIHLLRRTALITPDKLTVNAIKDDPSDNKVLSCAVEGEADFIISGDHHLNDLGIFQGIRIVTPDEFLGIIK